MKTDDAFTRLREIARKHQAHGETVYERLVYHIDQQAERILELEMDVAYWQEKYADLKAEHE